MKLIRLIHNIIKFLARLDQNRDRWAKKSRDVVVAPPGECQYSVIRGMLCYALLLRLTGFVAHCSMNICCMNSVN